MCMFSRSFGTKVTFPTVTLEKKVCEQRTDRCLNSRAEQCQNTHGERNQ